jgi:hypothetical protein
VVAAPTPSPPPPRHRRTAGRRIRYDAAVRALAPLCLATTAACAAVPGEPMEGTLVIEYADLVVEPIVGAAIRDVGGNALVVVGTRDISCQTIVQSQLRRGTYLSFSIEPMLGSHAPFVSVIRVVPGGIHINGTTGMVELERVDGRIAGSVEVDAEDAELGPITASGTFDVRRCF